MMILINIYLILSSTILIDNLVSCDLYLFSRPTTNNDIPSSASNHPHLGGQQQSIDVGHFFFNHKF